MTVSIIGVPYQVSGPFWMISYRVTFKIISNKVKLKLTYRISDNVTFETEINLFVLRFLGLYFVIVIGNVS